MRVLLDTNVVLWMALENKRLHKSVKQLLAQPSTNRLFSAATSWEIAVKWRLEKLPLPEHPRPWLDRLIQELALDVLPIRHDHTAHVADLPDHHRDPFDRVLIAQAHVEKVPIVTADGFFSKYDVETISAIKAHPARASTL